MRTRTAIWFLVAAVATAVATALGCGSDGASSTEMADGAVGDASSADATGSSQTDGGLAPPDSGATPLDAAVEAARSFCSELDAAGTVFCDDFDQPGRTSVVGTSWASAAALSGSIDHGMFASSPASALFAFDGGYNAAAKAGVFPLSKNRLTIAATVRVASGTTDAELYLGNQSATDPCSLYWPLVTGQLRAFCPGTTFVPTDPIPADTWVRLTITVTRQAGQLHATGRVGAGSIAEADIVTADGGALMATGYWLKVGWAESAVHGAVWIDDVVITEE